MELTKENSDLVLSQDWVNSILNSDRLQEEKMLMLKEADQMLFNLKFSFSQDKQGNKFIINKWTNEYWQVR